MLVTTIHAAQAEVIDESTGGPDVIAENNFFAFLHQQQDCRFYGRFAQAKYLSGLTKPLESSGQFLFDCQQGVIWQTNLPQDDALVLTAKRANKTARAYRVVDAQVERLKNRQSRFLSELMMSLMSADQTSLSERFHIVDTGPKSVRLTPKKGGLKRALKHIDVAAQENAEHEQVMLISILDRNEQRTEINSVKQQTHASLDQPICADQGLHPQLCALLYPLPSDSITN